MAERRKRTLIEQFQYKLIARMAAYWAIYQLTLLNFLFCWRLLEEGPGNLAEQFGRFVRESYPMLICFAVLVPAFVWDAVKFYHRVAGPLYRLRKTVQEVTDEKAVRVIRLRKGDELTELADDMNAMLAMLARRGAVTLIGPGPAASADDPNANSPAAPGDMAAEDVPCEIR
ncbi:MAG: hypothetical protein ACYC35_11595 [Pirellulales bacterium]